VHQPAIATEAEVIRLLKLVGISAPELRVRSYPHELSGGMQQRVMIAMAIASRPKVLIADEPTTALDVTIQAQIVELLDSLRQKLGMAILLITHNLGIVSQISDRVAVMYAGQIVEQGRTDEVLESPRHPYTRSLLDSVPKIGSGLERLASIPGAVPTVGAWPAGCRFHPRCFQSRPDCAAQAPGIATDKDSRQTRCLYPLSP
jgi:oligopeptide/dipeptide ABC transporter ATP-binding protein